MTYSENISKLTAELRTLRLESWSANDERTRQFFLLEDSLKNITHEVQDITTNVAKFNEIGVCKPLEQSVVEGLTARIAVLSDSQQNFTLQNAVLSSLDFPERVQRHEDITEAHHNTFKWIFGRSNVPDVPDTPKFINWLEWGTDVFWVSGRPGSGKSTLMKLINGSPVTKACLSRWASPKSIIIASYYFWSAGSAIQRSQEGLLRSLLHNLLNQLPDLIASVCGDRWTKFNASTLARYRWSQTELTSVLHEIIQRRELPIRFAFFIDGLDEYEGDGSGISQLMLDLGRCADIKLCVSSRPWNIFEDGFGRTPWRKLYVHELTQNDIYRYAKNRLSEHPRWLESSLTDLILIKSLASAITKRAQGVFLWVFLVTRELREGITNYDSKADLWKRFERLPVDLEQFFKHIILSVEPFYHEKMAGALLIAMRAEAPLPIEIYTFQELEYSDEAYALKQPIRHMTREVLKPLTNQTSRRLNGWCKGLIETRHDRVEFLHRTVRDFLQTGGMTIILHEKAYHNFHPCLSLVKACIAFLKSSLFVNQELWIRNTGSFEKSVRWILRYAKDLERGQVYQDSCEVLLDNVENSVQKMFSIGQLQVNPFQSTNMTARDVRVFFRQLVMMEDLGVYLSRKLDCDVEYFQDFGQPPLSMVLNTWAGQVVASRLEHRSGTFTAAHDYYQVLQSLLEHKENPNEPITDENPAITTTPWEEYIQLIIGPSLSDLSRTEDVFIHVLKSGTLTLLLDHGADPNAYVEHNSLDHGHAPFWMKFLFQISNLKRLWKYRDQYTRALRIIFESGVDFTLMNALTLDPSIESSSSEPKDSAWTYFCKVIKELSVKHTSGRAFEEPTLQFLAQVLVEFAKAAGTEDVKWDDLVPSLRRLFSQAQLRQVLQAMGKSSDQATLRLRKRYRVPG